MTPHPIHRVALIALSLSLLGALPLPGADEEKPLPPYQVVGGVAGDLLAVGSDTMVELMTGWAEGFRVLYPKVSITLEEKGSNLAPPALLEGRAQLAPMSRAMKPDEIAAFTRKFGYPPTEVVVAIDGLAIFVHHDNPLAGVTLRQLDAIFAEKPAQDQARITRWYDAGVPSLGAAPLVLYGRNAQSGTNSFFRQRLLGGRSFSAGINEKPGSEALIHGIAADLHGIGYCGIGYVTSGVRVVPVGSKEGEYFFPSPENCVSDTYPLARRLYLYVNRPPAGLDPAVREFLRFVLSRSGQEIVDLVGFYSVNAQQAEASLLKLAP